MQFAEVNRDLFSLPERFYLAHCISSDCALGAGIAVQFEKKFHLKSQLLTLPFEERKHPTCIKIGNVFNLITKEKCFHKPTLNTLESALISMRDQMVKENLHFVATYELGCHLDRLSWPNVEYLIKNIFSKTDINILICHYKPN